MIMNDADKDAMFSKDLRVYKMTEKEEIQSKITSLQKQLAAIEEEEKNMSPAEIAYKRVYGCYPYPCTAWEHFQKGYDTAKTENVNKVEEPLPAKDKVTLHRRFYLNGTYGCIGFDDALKVVREFLLDEARIDRKVRLYWVELHYKNLY